MSEENLPTIDEILKAHPAFLDEALSEQEASAFDGTPVATLRTLRCRGGGPKFFKRGSRVFYTRRTLLEHRNALRSTSDEAA